jgi:hypothetical protein
MVLKIHLIKEPCQEACKKREHCTDGRVRKNCEYISYESHAICTRQCR